MSELIKATVKFISRNKSLNRTFKKIAMKNPKLTGSLLKVYRNNGPVYDPVINKGIADEELRWYESASSEMAEVFSENVIRHIYFDFSSIVETPFITGIQRVTRALHNSMSSIYEDKDSYIVEAIYSEMDSYLFYRCECAEDEKYSRQDFKEIVDVIRFQKGDILFLTDTNFNHIAAKKNIYKDLMNKGIKVYAVLYDLIPMEYPEFYSNEIVHYFELYLNTISTLSGVIAISQTSLKAYETWLEDNNIKVHQNQIRSYFHLGSDFEQNKKVNDLKDINIEILNKLSDKMTFLMVGTVEPRKCHKQVLDAFEELWNAGQDINLVFVGKYGWHMEDIVKRLQKHKENGRHFFWLEGVSDEYLARIYECSTVVIQASLQEGFGLPLVEAFHYGKPVIARDIPIFREIIGDNAFYFTDDSPSSLADTICRWVDLYKVGTIPKVKDIELVSWNDSASELMLVINQDI